MWSRVWKHSTAVATGLLLSAVRAVYINRQRRALAANVGSDTLTAVDVAEHRLTCEAVTDNCCKRNMSVFSTTCYGCKRQYYRVHAQILHFWTENPNTLVTACNLQFAIGALKLKPNQNLMQHSTKCFNIHPAQPPLNYAQIHFSEEMKKRNQEATCSSNISPGKWPSKQCL